MFLFVVQCSQSPVCVSPWEIRKTSLSVTRFPYQAAKQHPVFLPPKHYTSTTIAGKPVYSLEQMELQLITVVQQHLYEQLIGHLHYCQSIHASSNDESAALIEGHPL